LYGYAEVPPFLGSSFDDWDAFGTRAWQQLVSFDGVHLPMALRVVPTAARAIYRTQPAHGLFHASASGHRGSST
jgi:hypothetical protein